MNSKNNYSLVGLLVLVIIFVLGSTKLERVAGDGYRGASVCNGTIGECGTGDEVELLLMHSPSRLLAGTNGKSISIDAIRYGDRAVDCNAKNFYPNSCIELRAQNSRAIKRCVTYPEICNKGSGLQDERQ